MWIRPQDLRFPGRRLPLLACLFPVLLASSLFATQASAQGLFVDSFTPTSGSAGTLVTLSGGGFAADPADHWAFVHDPLSGNGAVLIAASGTPTTWTGVLGPAAAPFTGHLRIWSGHLWQLPSKVLAGEAGVFLVERPRWYVPKDAVDAPGTFTVTSSLPNVVGASVEPDSIAFEMPNTGPSTIDLHITIDGGSTENIPPGHFAEPLLPQQKLGNSRSLTGSRAFSLRIHNIEPKSARPELLARDLGRILTETYGALGLVVEARGTRVYLSLEGAATYQGALGVLSWEP